MSSQAKVNSRVNFTPKKSLSSKYLDFYRKECNGLDARTFTNVRKQVFDYMKDDACPPEIKIMFGDWIFRKIYMYFKIRGELKDELCSSLIPAIRNCHNTVVKAEYLQFHDRDTVMDMTLEFYLQRFAEKDKYFILQMLNDVELVKGWVQDSRVTDDNLRAHFIEWLKASPIFEQQSNLLDVLLKYYPRDPDVLQIYQKMRFGESGKGNLYQDDQNVHDEEIKISVLEAAGKLLEDYYEHLDKTSAHVNGVKGAEHHSVIKPLSGVSWKSWAEDLLQKCASTDHQRDIIRCVVERMCIDTTTFETTVKGQVKFFSISEIFTAVMDYIILRSGATSTLYSIMMDEMTEMSELCASGYVARFLNVLRGFEERYEINVSFEKQLYAVLSHAIQKELDKAPENVVLGSFEIEHRHAYTEFICRKVNDIIPRLNKDYGVKDIYTSLANALTEITGIQGWRVNNQNTVSWAE